MQSVTIKGNTYVKTFFLLSLLLFGTFILPMKQVKQEEIENILDIFSPEIVQYIGNMDRPATLFSTCKTYYYLGEKSREYWVSKKGEDLALKTFHFFHNNNNNKVAPSIRVDNFVGERLIEVLEQSFAYYLLWHTVPRNFYQLLNADIQNQGGELSGLVKTYQSISLQQVKSHSGSFTRLPLYYFGKTGDEESINIIDYRLMKAICNEVPECTFSLLFKTYREEGEDDTIIEKDSFEFAVAECHQNCTLEKLEKVISFSRQQDFELKKIVLTNINSFFDTLEKIDAFFTSKVIQAFNGLITVNENEQEKTLALAAINIFVLEQNFKGLTTVNENGSEKTLERLEFLLRKNPLYATMQFPNQQPPLQVIFSELGKITDAWKQQDSENKCIAVSRLFLRYGAYRFINDYWEGETLLHQIALHPFESQDSKEAVIRYVELLLSKGADKTLKNRDGGTPYVVFSRKNNRVWGRGNSVANVDLGTKLLSLFYIKK